MADPKSPHELGDADDRTPTDLVARTPNSADRISLGTIESSLPTIAEDLGRLRQRWDRASETERRFIAERLAPELRQLGDNAHDLARWLEELVAGATD